MLVVALLSFELLGVLATALLFVLLVISSAIASLADAFFGVLMAWVLASADKLFSSTSLLPLMGVDVTAVVSVELTLVNTPTPAPCSLPGATLLGMVGGVVELVYSGALGSVLPC